MPIATNQWIIKPSAARRSSASAMSSCQRHEQALWISKRESDMPCSLSEEILHLLGIHCVLRLKPAHFSTGRQPIFPLSEPGIYCFTTDSSRHFKDFPTLHVIRAFLFRQNHPQSASRSMRNIMVYSSVLKMMTVSKQTSFGRTRRHQSCSRISLTAYVINTTLTHTDSTPAAGPKTGLGKHGDSIGRDNVKRDPPEERQQGAQCPSPS